MLLSIFICWWKLPTPTNVSVAKPLLTAPPCPGSALSVRLVPKRGEQRAGWVLRVIMRLEGAKSSSSGLLSLLNYTFKIRVFVKCKLDKALKIWKKKVTLKVTCIPGTDENYPPIAPVNISVVVIVNDSSVH